VTKKDLMVRLDIPRFFREGDKSVLTVVINNESAAELSGETALSVARDGAAAEDKFALKEMTKTFTVKAGGTVSLYWEITARPARPFIRSGPWPGPARFPTRRRTTCRCFLRGND